MAHRLPLWRWGIVVRRGGQETPWPWTQIIVFRRYPRKVDQ